MLAYGCCGSRGARSVERSRDVRGVGTISANFGFQCNLPNRGVGVLQVLTCLPIIKFNEL